MLKKVFEIIVGVYKKVVQDINLQIQEFQQIPSRIDTKKTTTWNIVIKLLKSKVENIRSTHRERDITYSRALQRIQGDISTETMGAHISKSRNIKILLDRQ